MQRDQFVDFVSRTKSLSCTSIEKENTINTLLDVAFVDDDNFYFVISKTSSFYDAMKNSSKMSINSRKEGQSFNIKGCIEEVNQNVVKKHIIADKELQREFKGKRKDLLAVMRLYSWDGKYFSQEERLNFTHKRSQADETIGFFSIDEKKCTRCGRCAESCPRGCIDLVNMTIWANNCDRCGYCRYACSEECIGSGFEKKKEERVALEDVFFLD
ncbi:MAG: 4Fe-4S binding protein [Bacilli bacterium]|nr:4Fe-4S binding protein [Bacilli bacterium]